MRQENPWQKIDLQQVNGQPRIAAIDDGEIPAPFDGERIDILAKKWEASTDTFRYVRFIDCEWDWDLRGFTGIDNGWRPEYWMTPPMQPPGQPQRPEPSEPFTKA